MCYQLIRAQYSVERGRVFCSINTKYSRYGPAVLHNHMKSVFGPDSDEVMISTVLYCTSIQYSVYIYEYILVCTLYRLRIRCE